MVIFRRTNELLAQIVEDCAPRPRDNWQVEVTVTVDVDPVSHGHDLSTSDAESIVVAAINARAGLEVVEIAEVTR